MQPALVVDHQETLVETMIERLRVARRRAVRSRNRFALAIPGGSVAEALLPKLAATTFDVERVHLFWVDERAVPPDHPDSNAGRARALWIDRLPIAPERVHRLHGEADDLDAAAREAETDLVHTLGDPPRLDVAILGVGPDGHVASLFPGHPAVADSRLVAAVPDAPKPPSGRLTMTLRALGSARELWIVAFGSEKAAVVERALRTGAEARPGEGGPLPVQLAARSGPSVTFFLDPEAAGRL